MRASALQNTGPDLLDSNILHFMNGQDEADVDAETQIFDPWDRWGPTPRYQETQLESTQPDAFAVALNTAPDKRWAASENISAETQLADRLHPDKRWTAPEDISAETQLTDRQCPLKRLKTMNKSSAGSSTDAPAPFPACFLPELETQLLHEDAGPVAAETQLMEDDTPPRPKGIRGGSRKRDANRCRWVVKEKDGLDANTCNGDGPVEFEDLMDWPLALVRTLQNWDMEAMQLLIYNLQNLKYSSHYSGIDMNFIGLTYIVIALKHLNLAPDLEFPAHIHSCDSSSMCQELLKKYKPPFRPQHVLGDLENRLSDDARERLAELERPSDCAFPEVVRYCNDQKTLVLDEPGSYPPEKEDYCELHEKSCRVWDGPVRDFAEGLTLNSAGTACLDYTPFGQSKGPAGDCQQPYMVWRGERVVRQEALTIQECSDRFPVQEQLKSKVEPNFQVQHALLCPSYFGYPKRRRRSYAAIIHRLLEFTGSVREFRDMFCRKRCHLDYNIWFQASQQDIQKEIERLAKQRHIHRRHGEKELTYEDVIDVAHMIRRGCYREQANLRAWLSDAAYTNKKLCTHVCSLC